MQWLVNTAAALRAFIPAPGAETASQSTPPVQIVAEGHLSASGSFARRLSTAGTILSLPQLEALMSVSLTMAVISVLASMYAFYSFVRMRRSFRHDLIMILIQSDMIKALWLFICPVAFFLNSPLDSHSIFCQISGFFLTLSIEASDIAVLLIALHTALLILMPQTSNGVSGLYPYRYVAYALWAVLPIILAAVVPITGGTFENNGPHCYLPIDPKWYRRALSWIPRYVIFISIIVGYTFLYLYVMFRFRRFGESQSRDDKMRRESFPRAQKHPYHRHPSSIVSSSQLLLDHGLLAPPQEGAGNDRHPRSRHGSVPSTVSSTLNSAAETSASPRQMEQVQTGSMRWNPVVYDDNISAEPHTTRDGQLAADGPISPSCYAAERNPVNEPDQAHCRPLSSSQQSEHSYFSWKRLLSRGSQRAASCVSEPTSAAQSGQRRPEGAGQTQTPSTAYICAGEPDVALRRSRKKMQRQLRLLFVYPAIYLLTWIAPFVSHVTWFNDEYAIEPTYPGHPPMSLQLVSLVSLCIGAAVDCAFFSLWEKPWRHLRGGFWECLVLWLDIFRPIWRSTRGTGRSREERFMDARTARLRREQETQERINGGESATAAGGDDHRPGDAAPREWWDALDVDMSMV
ncbi:G protein-coupled glucose receptor regulating Gpa2-domain-containing protein [Hypoxylon sp. FL1284]|nr:G protein-coupled glucose receptor regulating Gpa2-domain-containing protein [Hypoxylon sp. FL1284]